MIMRKRIALIHMHIAFIQIRGHDAVITELPEDGDPVLHHTEQRGVLACGVGDHVAVCGEGVVVIFSLQKARKSKYVGC